jgi:AbrB family looped-hinge helix DNA binding protein
MPKVRVNYDGWIALPAAVRQKLALSTGDQLDLELSGETVILRRSEAAPASRVPEPIPVSAAGALPSEPSPVAEPEPTTKRGPGRPRKVSASVALPPGLKARGSRRKNATEGQEVQ